MRVLFLDFDGVLNNAQWRHERAESGNGNDIFEQVVPEHVARLNAIVERTGCKIVVSSSWRKVYSVDELRCILVEAGFVGEVIDHTPALMPHKFSAPSVPRGREVQRWLDEHLDVKSFVGLDDDADYAHLAHRLVRTDDYYGLLDEHVERAVALLTESA